MHDVVIVGAGPAGLTAALYTGRAKLKTRLLEKLSAGGQVLLSETIENFPGVYKMSSHGWVDSLKQQIAELEDVEFSEEMTVSKIESLPTHLRVAAASAVDGHREIVETKAVILATGAQPKRLGIKGEEELTGRGVSYCATCDGPLFREKEVVVIGGGDTAIEEALYLAKIASRVTVVHRRDTLRATAVLQERVLSNPKIVLRWNSVPEEILGKSSVEAVRIRNIRNDTSETLACRGIFIFVGLIPDTGFMKGLMDLNEAGSIITDENLMTSCGGIFACGDCRQRPFNQIVTACSEGAVAAYSVKKFLETKV